MDDPHDILQVDKNATLQEIQQSYRKLQLKYHPDRKTGDSDMYMRITSAYKSITTKESFLTVYKNFKTKYIDSEEEHFDLLQLYNKYKGNMRKIIDNHILSEYPDEPRLRMILEKYIEDKKIKRYAAYKKKINSKQKGNVNIEKLAELLQKNDEKRKNFVDKLEEKYCNKLKK